MKAEDRSRILGTIMHSLSTFPFRAVSLPCALLFCALFATFSLCQAQTRLLLHDQKGNLLYEYPLTEGACFGIRFIHSVAKSPVEDWFCQQNKKLFLEKTIYHDFGAGLPYKPEKGEQMTFGNGHIVISGIHREIPSFDQRVGRIAEHTLLYEEGGTRQEKKLSDFVPPGCAITFSLETRSDVSPSDKQKNE